MTRTKLTELSATWRWRIQKAGLTVTEFCKKIDMPYASFYSIVSGNSNPSIDVAEKIESALFELEKQ